MLWSAVAVYAALLLFVVYSARKHSSADEFLMADRNASALQVAAGLFTLIGGGELVVLASLGFLFGWSGIALFAGYALGFLFLGLIVGTVRKDSRTRRFVSLPDYVHYNFGAASGLVAFLFSALAFFSLLMLQFSAAGAVISPFLGISEGAVIVFVGVAVLSYLLIGGFRAVLTTDVIQGIIMVLLLPILLYLAVSGVSGATIEFKGTEGSLSVPISVSLIVTGFFVVAGSADVWQRAYAAKSDSIARSGFLAGALTFFLFGFPIVLIGMAASSLGVADPDNAFVSVMTQHLPEEVAALVALLVLAAMMSTADTEAFLLTGLFQHELRRFFPNSRLSTALNSIGGVRLVMLLVGASSIVFAYFFRDLVGIYTWLLSSLVVISPIIMFSLFKKASPSGMFFALLANTIVFASLVGSGRMNLDNLYLIAIPGVAFYFIALAIKNRVGANN